MKKLLLAILFTTSFGQFAFSQSERVIGPAEKKLTDSICNNLNKRDLSKVTNKEQAIALYTDCVMAYTYMLGDVADELKVDMQDGEAMKKVGMNIAFSLMKNQCTGFTKLAKYMAGTGENEATISSTTGTLKRIDNKGFNYLVLSENGAEKSFLWLRQFAGSEQFNNGITTSVGKKVKIKWQEIEVYLPAAKGYYKVKEITEVSFL